LESIGNFPFPELNIELLLIRKSFSTKSLVNFETCVKTLNSMLRFKSHFLTL